MNKNHEGSELYKKNFDLDNRYLMDISRFEDKNLNSNTLKKYLEELKLRVLETILIVDDIQREKVLKKIFWESEKKIRKFTGWDKAHVKQVLKETFSIETISSCANLVRHFDNYADASIRFVTDKSYDGAADFQGVDSQDELKHINDDIEKIQNILNCAGVIGESVYDSAQNIVDVSMLKDYLNSQIIKKPGNKPG